MLNLPIGSIVKLKNFDLLVMITGKLPLVKVKSSYEYYDFLRTDLSKIIHLVVFIPLLLALARRFRDTGLKEGILIIIFVILGCMPTGKFNKN